MFKKIFNNEVLGWALCIIDILYLGLLTFGFIMSLKFIGTSCLNFISRMVLTFITGLLYIFLTDIEDKTIQKAFKKLETNS